MLTSLFFEHSCAKHRPQLALRKWSHAPCKLVEEGLEEINSVVHSNSLQVLRYSSILTALAQHCVCLTLPLTARHAIPSPCLSHVHCRGSWWVHVGVVGCPLNSGGDSTTQTSETSLWQRYVRNLVLSPPPQLSSLAVRITLFVLQVCEWDSCSGGLGMRLKAMYVPFLVSGDRALYLVWGIIERECKTRTNGYGN